MRKKNKGNGRGAEKREGLIIKLSSLEKGGPIREGGGACLKGGLNREFTVNVQVLEEPPHLCIQITN